MFVLPYPCMERKHHFDKITGTTPKKITEAHEGFEYIHNIRSKILSPYDTPKTPEEIEYIQQIEKVVDEIVTSYGGKIKEIPIDNIYIVNPGDIEKASKGQQTNGISYVERSDIGVERRNSKLSFASTLAHEMFHVKAFRSAKIDDAHPIAYTYRAGITLTDTKTPVLEDEKNRIYFAPLEEAIVTECARKALEKLSTQESFKEEYDAVKKIIGWVAGDAEKRGERKQAIDWLKREVKYIPGSVEKVKLIEAQPEHNRDMYARRIFDTLYDQRNIEVFERTGERIAFYTLLDEIIKKSDGRFKTHDELFGLFAQAQFSGNYLPLARTVEEILGDGAFRKIAQEFTYKPKE